MALKHLLTTNLIILARRLKHVHIRLDNTFSLDRGQFLTRGDRLKLQAMQRRIDKDITTVKSITSHIGHDINNPRPASREPNSDPIANEYRS